MNIFTELENIFNEKCLIEILSEYHQLTNILYGHDGKGYNIDLVNNTYDEIFIDGAPEFDVCGDKIIYTLDDVNNILFIEENEMVTEFNIGRWKRFECCNEIMVLFDKQNNIIIYDMNTLKIINKFKLINFNIKYNNILANRKYLVSRYISDIYIYTIYDKFKLIAHIKNINSNDIFDLCENYLLYSLNDNSIQRLDISSNVIINISNHNMKIETATLYGDNIIFRADKNHYYVMDKNDNVKFLMCVEYSSRKIQIIHNYVSALDCDANIISLYNLTNNEITQCIDILEIE